MATDIQKRLVNYFERKSPTRENIRISNLKRISDGWENDVYLFTIKYVEGSKQSSEKLVLRVYPGDNSIQKSEREFKAMKRLYEADFPVPEVLILELDISYLGKPFVIMEKIDGQSMGKVIDNSSENKKQKLLNLFCSIFVKLHKLDWKPFVSDLSLKAEKSSEVFQYEILKMHSYLQTFQKYEFKPVLDWLKGRMSDICWRSLSVIHLDYHPYNILLTDDGAPFVIDWTNVRIFDYRFDLAWTLLLTSTYDNPEARELILSEYEKIANYKVEQIEYFEVAASLRRLFSISVSLSNGAERLGMRPGAESMMKKNVKHIKNVYTVLLDRTDIAIPEIEKLISNLV